jgi:polysaccharide export outer membrane protein
MRTTIRMIRLWISCFGAFLFGIVAVDHAWSQGRILTPSDVVTIKVVGQPDLDVTTRVEPDGTINFPYVGRVKAAGTTEDSLARTIESRLAARQIVTEPHVLIEIANFGTQASVQGQVGAPGTYTIDRSTTLSQLLAKAGGLKDTGGTVTLRRHGPRGPIIMRYEGRDLITGRINGDRILILNNDEIFVDLLPFYYVYGFVGRTGEFPLMRPLTVQQAISIAGGLTPLGSDSRLWIKRKAAGGQTMEVPASLDDDVRPNDTIIVNERIF